MNPAGPGTSGAVTGRSPVRRQAPPHPAVDRVDLPEDLVTAIRAGRTDPGLPAQGNPELRFHVLAGGPAPHPDDLEAWLDAQRQAQSLVPALIEALPPVVPGELSLHQFEWWYELLPFPWAEDLFVAVVAGLSFVNA